MVTWPKKHPERIASASLKGCGRRATGGDALVRLIPLGR
jgi:hypothetical protein